MWEDEVHEWTGHICPECNQGLIYYDPVWKAYYCDDDHCDHAHYEEDEEE